MYTCAYVYGCMYIWINQYWVRSLNYIWVTSAMGLWIRHKNLDDVVFSNIAFIMNINVISSAKSSHVCTQGKIQLIATLNYYACSVPPLASVNWFAFPEWFLLTM